MTGDDGAFKHLDSLSVALFDEIVDTHGVADLKGGDGFLELIAYKSLEFRHNESSVKGTFMRSFRRGLFRFCVCTRSRL